MCRGWLAASLALCLAMPAWAGPAAKPRAVATAGRVGACLASAAEHHALDPDLLHAIASVESGLDPSAVNRANTNGSRDIGLMQINSAWLPALARWKITEEQLYDPCVSAYVGAWILANNIARLGPTWRAVGAYNARTPAKQLAYVRRVQKQLAQAAGMNRSSGGR